MASNSHAWQTAKRGEMLLMSFAALLCGVRSYEWMEEFCELREGWLRKWLMLPNGLPCTNTFSRVWAWM